MPRRNDLRRILIIGSGPIVIGQACEFDYSGHAGRQGAARGGLRGRPRQLEPGDDHDRSRSSRTARTSSRSSRATLRGHHRAREAGCAPADARRADRAQPRARARRRRRARRSYGVEMLGAQARVDPQGRGPLALQGGDGEDRASSAASRLAHSVEEARRDRRRDTGFPAILRPAFTHGRQRAAASPRTRASSRRRCAGRSRSRRRTRCSSRRASSAGRSSSSRSCATARTTSSSSARSRTSIRWACTPATRSPSRRR